MTRYGCRYLAAATFRLCAFLILPASEPDFVVITAEITHWIAHKKPIQDCILIVPDSKLVIRPQFTAKVRFTQP